MSGRDEKRALSRRQAHLTIWGAYVTILGTIIGLAFAWSQLRIARAGEERARRAEPLAYTLEAVDTHYQYEIRQGDRTVTTPAPVLRLQVTHGSLHAITVISFDGDEFYELSQLPMQDGWEECVVDIAVPSHAAMAEGDVVYDYFFLYLEPSEGRRQLDLICTAVSLDTYEVESSAYHPVVLAQADLLPDRPQREMFAAYSVLYERLQELELFAG